MAIVQGVTEFFPVSSSGHLIILHNLFSINLSSDLSFDVALHFGTLMAMLLYFYQDLINYLRKSPKFLLLIVLASIPAGLVGLLLNDFIEQNLRSDWVVVTMLILVGILFIIIEKISLSTLDLSSLNYKKALFIGCAQIISLIPGTSRSGITIIAGMQQKLKRQDAAKFSFLIGIPIIAAAALKKSWDLREVGLMPSERIDMLVGVAVSAMVGFFCIKYFLKFLEKYSLKWFAYYRFLLAFIVIIYLLFK